MPAKINENISNEDGDMDEDLREDDLDIPLSPISKTICECRASDYVPGCMVSETSLSRLGLPF
jgi:hypothetical protein